MKRFILCGSLFFFLLAMLMMVVQPLDAVGAEQKAALLADRHAARKIDCQGCHDAGGAPKAVLSEKCLTCHKSYEHMGELTKGLAINPHDSHFGKIECLQCHNAHKKSTLYCNKCHDYDLKVP